MTDTYFSIQSPTEGLYKEKGSKFIAFAYPCSDEEQAKIYLTELKKSHPTARHHCFAWRFGSDTNRYLDRYSDDGEPSNSAGKPIFGQIKAFEVTNVLVVVIRYFGGTKLGVGGLIHAYKTAAQDALQQAKIQTYFISDYFKLTYDFSLSGVAMNTIKKSSAEITEQGYEGQKALTLFKIRQSESNELQKSFNELHGFELKLLKTE